MKFVALIAKTGTGYSAHLPDLPGCIAAAGTFEETRELIQEAAAFHLEGMVEDGETIPQTGVHRRRCGSGSAGAHRVVTNRR